MRRSALILVSLVPLLHFACVDDSIPPPFTFDGGFPQFDGSLPDGTAPPPVDAGPDAPDGPRPVTVRVLRRDTPLAGITVVFGDASGAILESGQTDADGRIARVVPAGSQVTAVFGTTSQRNLVTVLAVEPGDVLTAIEPSFNLVGFADVTAIPASPPSGTTYYSAFAGPCYTGLPLEAPVPTQLDFSSETSCSKDGRFPLVLVAQDEGLGTLAFAYKKGNSFVTDGGTASVAVGGTWSTETGLHTVSVANRPADLQYFDLVSSEWADGVRFSRVAQPEFGMDASVPNTDFMIFPGYADTLQAEALVRKRTERIVSTRILATKASAAKTSSIDLAQLLPEITDTAFDGATPARPSISWTSTGTANSSDAVFANLRWVQESQDAGLVAGSWTFVAPPSVSSIKAPALPADFTPSLPSSDVSLGLPTVAFVEASFVADYKQLRSLAATIPLTEDLVLDRTYNGAAPELKVDGVLRISAATANNAR